MKVINIFISNYLKGDKYLWAFISLLTIFSFLPVYSASSGWAIRHYNGAFTIFYCLLKHILFLLVGYCIIFFTQFISYKYFYKISILLIFISFILLVITVLQDNKLNGVNASRWLHIPIISISFQTSSIGSLSVFIYTARYLSKYKKIKFNFINFFIKFLFPVFIITGLIFPSNGSTAVIIFISILIIIFISGPPILNFITFFLLGIFLSTTYIFFVTKYFNKNSENRVLTWKNRIEKFLKNEDSYQMIQSKTAIIIGNKFGLGPGKSIVKNFLPLSYSDFIYAIIIEEYGLFGGIILLFIYLLILFRIIVIATKVQNYFCTLLVFSIGFPIIIQSLINMGITVGIFPITGQTLPLISAGGSSIWITFFSFGIILSVSKTIYEKS
ncbi:FtsW/RodA/SpoVE family cell cycle protein [Blattabacterium cuenoti]|uniref:FtsW/RodA/SpoVE family cell cycle protein n=1 Tax=Blattabacterium cuenoti TaxID=1653831 RepID=UPI00163D0DC9|nr:FtsW/RodA/SpoVE family cell cycle protein [Blattabacterium cuenoti]